VLPTLPAGIDTLGIIASITDDGSNGADQNPVDNTSSDTTPVAASPDMSIVIDDSLTTVVPGQSITYTATITNIGDQNATGVTATTSLSAYQNFVSASNGGTLSGPTISWNIGPVAVGQVIS
jgi:uncharacterized repeat protein (TIGR01451 family)